MRMDPTSHSLGSAGAGSSRTGSERAGSSRTGSAGGGFARAGSGGGGPFGTDHLKRGLGARTARGGIITLSSQAAFMILNTGAIAVLARLLTPDDFGLIAMVAIVIGLVNVIKEAGLSPATIQRRDLTHGQVSNLFWANLGISLLLMGILAASAPYLARFYGRPELRMVTIAFAGTLIFSGLSVQHQALLRRQMRFVALAAIRIVSLLLSAGAAIACAAAGWGYWSLVVMQGGMVVVGAVGAWIACRWVPSRPARRESVRSLLAFGGHFVAADLLNYLCRTLDKMLVAKFAGAAALGFYSRAFRLLLLPISQLNVPLNTVAIPALSRLQDEPARFRDYYRQGLQMIVTAGVPLVAFTFVTADEIVLLLLGDQWAETVLFFRVLAPAALVGTVNVAAMWLFVALGRADRRLRAVAVHSAVLMAAVVIGLWQGDALGIAIGYSAAMLATRVPFLAYACHGTPVRLADIGAVIWRPLLAGGMAGGGTAVLLEAGLGPVGIIPRFLISGLAFVLLYGGLWMVLPGGRARVRGMLATVRNLRTPPSAPAQSGP